MGEGVYHLSISSEDEFQEHMMGLLSAGGAHVQDHRHSAQPHVPDMSVAINGHDFWFELKYERIGISKNPPMMNFSQTTRGQLEWLKKRQTAGRSICGILGFVNSLDFGQHIMFIPPQKYINDVWGKGFKIGSSFFITSSTPAGTIISSKMFLRFLSNVNRLYI